MSLSRKEARKLAVGLAFLSPNIIGFAIFTLFPLLISFALAFTNWDLRLHNMFREASPRFVGFENFVRLFREPDFRQYLGNTLFMMMGIPFSVAGSLLAALVLHRDLRGRTPADRGAVLIALLFIAGTAAVGTGILVFVGAPVTAMALLLLGLAGLILLGGGLAGRTLHRTLFYFPHFTAGVATFLLWKKLYNPHTGPFNNVLRPVLDAVSATVTAIPAGVFRETATLAVAAGILLTVLAAIRLGRAWVDGEAGTVSLILAVALLCFPAAFLAPRAGLPAWLRAALAGGALATLVSVAVRLPRREFTASRDRGLGYAVITSGFVMTLQFALVGGALVLRALPAINSDGLAPPEWLQHYHWAKPSLMLMGFWAAIGSNNMLLYLAGLSNIPPELYEAADIDGASPTQRFWNVTWPQLAPVTFFIAVMAVIGGLQGGFEMARTMTAGGPVGSTTTLSYYVYIEGFETGRLGYASAVAWTLFALVFVVTLFNWKFGNRYTNE